jgi:hypothetical protein
MPEPTIVVIGHRIYDPQVIFGSIDEGSGNSDHPMLSPEPGGGPLWPSESAYLDCLKDGVAYDVAQRIKALEVVLEQGAMIFKDADGHVSAGVIGLGTDMNVHPNVPGSIGYANILGQIHSHLPTGNAVRDAYTFLADRYPSPDDWIALGELGIQVAANGGDITDLSMYIIDQLGEVREYTLADRPAYDLTADQLLGVTGPPPPPPPAPISVRPEC